MDITFHILVYLVIGLTVSIFGLLVYFKDRKNTTYKTFGLMNLALAGWAFGCVLWLFQTDEKLALFWTRIFCLSATLIPVFLLHHILAFLKKDKEKRAVLRICYFITAVFIFFSFSSLYVKEVKPILNFPFWPQAGPVYIFYLIFGYFGMWFYGLYQLILAHKKNTGRERMQIRYVILGSILGVGSGATNFLLMLGVSLIPPLNVLILAYPLLFSYAMMKHKLMDIRVVLTEFLVFLIGVILLIEVFLAKSLGTIFYKSGILFVYGFFGYLLIKSVLKEIKNREKLQELAAKLEKAYRELKKLDEAKSEFISIASHQLRTPLTAIKGYISMMREKIYGEPSEKMGKPLENIYLSNERLIRLVNDLLNVSRIEAGRMEMELEKLSLEEIITSVVEELKNIIKERGIYLKFEKPEKALPKISADREKIRQVVMNVIDNAIRYTEKGGVTIKLKIENLKLKIVVSDTGAGLTKYELSKMFGSFSRGTAGTRLYTEGVGLGLYVARRFVEMHDGKIWAESKGKDKGSAFYIELPIK